MITETPSGSAAAARSLPGLQARVHARLRDAGFSEDASSALMAFDIDQFSYVRRVLKGELPLTLLRDLGAGVEATQFHALTVITRIQCGSGRQVPAEATVGLLAEEMNVDPSRASRIAADLVERG